MDTSFDLGTSTSVPISAIETDAAGNVVSHPVRFDSVDNNASVSDNGDGTGSVSRTSDGATTAVVSATVTNPDGSTVTGTLTISIAAKDAPSGNASAVEIVPGIPS